MASILTVGRLLDALGGTTLTLPGGATGLDVEVAGPRIFDPLDPADLGAGDVVLGVGVAEPEAGAVIAAAASAGAAAVALRGDKATLGSAMQSAADAGILLLAVSTGTTWGQLYELIGSALSASGNTGDSEDAPIRDLFALANAIAAMVGGAVAIEDPRSNLLAYSNLDQPIDEARRETILGRRNPSVWADAMEEGGISRLLARSTGVVRIADPGGVANDRLATLVRAGSEVLGSIWVVRGEKPLDDAGAAALAEATPLAALHLLRHRAFHDFSRRDRGALLRSLLESVGPVGDAATRLGVPGSEPCTVVAFALGIDDDVELSVTRGRAVDLITVACEAFRRRVVCAWIGSTIYALFPSMGGTHADRLTPLVGDICERSSRALGLTIRAGIGTVAADLTALRTSRESADAVIRVLTQTTAFDGPVATVDDVRVPGILLVLADLMRSRSDLRLPSLQAVRDEPSEQARDYLTTMRAFIDAAGDIALVAERLNVHRNTVRYRLHRLKDNYGLDLFDPGQRLIVTLELLASD